MKNRMIVLIALSIAIWGSLAVAEENPTFKVIVHATNPAQQLTKQELSQLFLKKVKQWKESNDAVLPVDLVDNSPIRQNFSETIHGRDVASIKAYWQKQIFSGRGVPPEEKKSDEEVLKYVSENPGAVGYISEATSLEAYQNVKVFELANNK
jgi:ABC-type phosphate transport system substrate-binding protein